jgi:hypothetical protein
MFAVTPAAATTGRQWLESSGLITVVRAAFHLCPLMRIREAFRYLWPIHIPTNSSLILDHDFRPTPDHTGAGPGKVERFSARIGAQA